jgi:type I restriction enzyme S subunit
MEFVKRKLRDVASVIISGVDKKNYDDEKPIRLCNFVDVYRNWAITSSMRDGFMTATAKQKEIDRFLLHKGQVAITKDSETRDDIGIATYIADDFEDVILGYHCALITPNNEVVDSKYLNAFLHSNYILRYFELNATGSGMRYTLSNDTILDMPILLLPMQQQKGIGELLSNIDKQIVLLNAINRNLEQLAQQLYDYWFVQFDFPNDEGKPYKSSGGEMVWNEKLKRDIPKDWNSGIVSDYIKPIERGVSYASENLQADGVPMINLACFSKQGDYRTGELKYYVGEFSDRKTVIPLDMLIACTDMTQGADIIGRPILATKECDSFIFSMDLAKIVPDGIEKMYLYYTLRTPFYHKYIKPFATGTTVKHLNVNGVETYALAIPSSKVQGQFEQIITPIKQLQMELINQIHSLKKYRDELLPMLLNGQVSVGKNNEYDFKPVEMALAAEPGNNKAQQL